MSNIKLGVPIWPLINQRVEIRRGKLISTTPMMINETTAEEIDTIQWNKLKQHFEEEKKGNLPVLTQVGTRIKIVRQNGMARRTTTIK